MNKKDTNEILSDLEKGYDLVADKFSSTRAYMWRDLDFIQDCVSPKDKILDFGCGNGRLAGYLKDNYTEYVGIDISQKLIDTASQKYNSEKTKFIKVYPVKSSYNEVSALGGEFNRVNPSSSKLPFKDTYFDAVFSIAVFHHFPSRDYADKIAKELYRVLKPNGKIVVTVWNLWQEQYLKYHQKSNKNWIGAEIPFRTEKKIFQRYHHPFKIGEMIDLFRSAGFKKIKTQEGWNLVYIGHKPSVDKRGLTGIFG